MVLERPITGFTGWGEESPPPKLSRQTLIIGGAILAVHLAGAVYLYTMRAAPAPMAPPEPGGILVDTFRLKPDLPPPAPEKPVKKVEAIHQPTIDTANPPPTTVEAKPVLEPQNTAHTDDPPVFAEPQPKANSKPADAGAKVIRNPTWLARPTPDQLNRYYPAGALEQGLPGRADLDCTVTAKGELTACRISGETPRGRGFGEAALKLSRIFRMSPRTEDGQPVEGGSIQIPIRFAVAD